VVSWRPNYTYLRINGNSYSSSTAWTGQDSSGKTIYIGSDDSANLSANAQLADITFFQRFLDGTEQYQLYLARRSISDVARTDVLTLQAPTGYQEAQTGDINIVGALKGTSLTVSGAAYLAASNGNVGIGLTNPAQKLDVTGGSIQASGQLISTTTGIAPLVVSSTTVVTNLNADLLDGQSGAYYLDAPSEATVEGYIANDVNTNYIPRDNGTKLVTGSIYDNGTNIGIGTSTTYGRLQVGTTPTVPLLIVQDSGNVGIGTTNPVGLFQVGSDLDNVPLYVKTTNGSVGIGTTNPAEKLECNGAIKMAAFKMATGAGDGYVLTSDASGNGTWQTTGCSSARYKTDIRHLDDDFYKILKVDPKYFTYKRTGQKAIGYIAEDFDALGLKHLVGYNKDGLPDTISYDKLAIYTIEVLKDHQVYLERLKKLLQEAKKELLIAPPVGKTRIEGDLLVSGELNAKQVSGLLKAATASRKANCTLTDNDNVIFADASGGAFTITLPTASQNTVGRLYYVYKVDSSANAIAVEAAGKNKINGAAKVSTNQQWKCLRIIGYTDSSWIAGDGSP
jgi:hypothetical protein